MKRKLTKTVSALLLIILLPPLTAANGQPESIDDLLYSTFFGGSEMDRIRDIKLDSRGNIIFAGGTFSDNLPMLHAAQETYAGGEMPPGEYMYNLGEAFVAKFSPDYELLWSTYLGGSDLECIYHVEIDQHDNVIVVGRTSSDDFPSTFPSMPAGNEMGDPFIAMYTPEGELIGARLYHPDQLISIEHVDVDSSGNLVMSGGTSSTDMYVTEDAFQSELMGETDGFVRVVSPDFEEIIFSTYIGGSGEEFLGEVYVTSDDSILISGSTTSDDLPVTDGALRSELTSTEMDNFVAKISPSRNLVTCTYLGGSDVDHVFGLSEGPDDSIVFVGRTWSNDYPVTTNAFQPEYSNTEVDGFLTEINGEGTELLYSTYYGREDWDSLLQVNMDEDQKLVITGFVHSGGFDTVNAFQTEYKGSSDIVLMVWGDEIELITLLGSYGSEHPFEQVLQHGKIFLVGGSSSPDFMVSDDAYQSTLAGDTDGYLWVFDYDTYLTGGYVPDPPGPDYRQEASYIVVLGAIALWFVYMRRTFSD
jgi:hypothetical protein